MSAVVVGGGAIGLLYAARLTGGSDPNRVTLVTRTAEQAAGLAGGWALSEPDGSRAAASCAVLTAAELAPAPADLVILATPAYDLASAAKQISPAVGAGTLVLTLQNGIAAADVAGQALSTGRIVPGASTFVVSVSTKAGRTRVAVSREGESFLGLDGDEHPELVAWFDRAGLNPVAGTSVDEVIWTKAVIATSGIACLALDADFGKVAGSDSFREAAWSMSLEIAAVAASAGVEIDLDSTRERLERLWDGVGPNGQTSLVEHYRAGRRTELADRIGPILALAERNSVAVPALRTVYALARTRIGMTSSTCDEVTT